MSKSENIDEVTEALRQSVIDTKSKKYCLKGFSGDVFELTSDMLVNNFGFDKMEKTEIAGVAECILHKYAKLLSISK